MYEREEEEGGGEEIRLLVLYRHQTQARRLSPSENRVECYKLLRHTISFLTPTARRKGKNPDPQRLKQSNNPRLHRITIMNKIQTNELMSTSISLVFMLNSTCASWIDSSLTWTESLCECIVIYYALLTVLVTGNIIPQ